MCINMISSQAKNASLPLEATKIKEGVKLEYKTLFLKANLSHILDSKENTNLTDWKLIQVTSDYDNDEFDKSIELTLHFTPK